MNNLILSEQNCLLTHINLLNAIMHALSNYDVAFPLSPLVIFSQI